MLKAALLVTICYLVSVESLTISDPEEQWVTLGGEVTLVCQSSEKVSSCTWQTPYGDLYPLAKNQKAESGRLEHFANDDGSDCGIKITKTEEKDMGTWSCTVGAVDDNNEVTSGKGQTLIHLAKAPETVRLVQNNFNFSIVDQTPRNVTCVAEHADPKPNFVWYIGDEELTNLDTEDAMMESEDYWMQTVHYLPKMEHDNQTLKCIVEHVGLKESPKEASAVLHFVDLSPEYIKMEEERKLLENTRATFHWYYGLILAVFIVIVLFGSLYWHRRHVARLDEEAAVDKKDEEDEEKNESKEENKADEEENTNGEVKIEINGEASKTSEVIEEEMKKGLGERMASFFRFKTKNENKEEEEEEESKKENGDFVAVEVDGNGEEKKDEEKQVEEKEPKESKMTKFFRMFKFGSGETKKSEEENMAMEDKEEEKKPIEYEPEEKEEKKEEEVEEENNKTEPKNTDV